MQRVKQKIANDYRIEGLCLKRNEWVSLKKAESKLLAAHPSFKKHVKNGLIEIEGFNLESDKKKAKTEPKTETKPKAKKYQEPESEEAKTDDLELEIETPESYSE